jgi:hypothetical protein
MLIMLLLFHLPFSRRFYDYLAMHRTVAFDTGSIRPHLVPSTTPSTHNEHHRNHFAMYRTLLHSICTVVFDSDPFDLTTTGLLRTDYASSCSPHSLAVQHANLESIWFIRSQGREYVGPICAGQQESGLHCLSSTLLVGGYGACVKIKNNTGIIGPDKYCTSSHLGFELNINMNDTVFTNFVSRASSSYFVFCQR